MRRLPSFPAGKLLELGCAGTAKRAQRPEPVSYTSKVRETAVSAVLARFRNPSFSRGCQRLRSNLPEFQLRRLGSGASALSEYSSRSPSRFRGRRASDTQPRGVVVRQAGFASRTFPGISPEPQVFDSSRIKSLPKSRFSDLPAMRHPKSYFREMVTAGTIFSGSFASVKPLSGRLQSSKLRRKRFRRGSVGEKERLEPVTGRSRFTNGRFPAVIAFSGKPSVGVSLVP